MRLSVILALFLCCIGFRSVAQSNSVSGVITDVKPYFAGEYALTVSNNTLIIIVDPNDQTKK
ncbi:MAG: hypothetical protein ACXVNQ_12020, partial [Bacteroidia bacterium]